MTRTVAPIGIGVVGCGHVTTARHLPALAVVPDAKLVAFADSDRSRLAELGELYGDAALYPNVHDLLADRRVDVVAACVPAASHAEVVLAALDAGVPVLVEEPLALALDDAETMASRAEDTGTPALVGFNLRWHRHVQRAAEALRDGELGELELVRSITTSPMRFRPDAPGWAGDREHGGGALIEAAVHHYDLWRYLTGAEVEEVSVISRSRLTDDDAATVSARLSSGALVSAVFCDGTSSVSGVTLFGSEGSVDVSFLRFDGLTRQHATTVPGPGTRAAGVLRAVRELRPGLRARRSGGELLASYRAEWEHFLDAVRTDEPAECTLEDGVEALRIALAAAESAETGRPVAVDEAPRTIPARVQ
jgi:myo-inositol 2-dehydrogenase/D-chiro-inositol 1-dehydrogenase